MYWIVVERLIYSEILLPKRRAWTALQSGLNHFQKDHKISEL